MTGDINFQKSGIVRYLHNQITFWGYGLTMDTGDDSDNIGARLILRSPLRSGEFGLTAKNGDSQYTVYGNATGTLTWAGQQIARFQSASLTGSPWYVKFHNGLIIQGQNYHITSWGASTVTLPIAFQSTNYVTSVTSWIYRGTSFTKAPEVCVLSRTTTSFDVYCVVGSALPTNWGEYISYVCIGY